MKLITKLLCLALVVCPIARIENCKAAAPSGTSNMDLANSITEFGLDIFKELPNKQVDNVILSPVSLVNPFNMLLLGTTKDTVQKEELERVLKYKQLLASSPDLNIHEENKQLTGQLAASTNLSTVSISNMIAANTDQVKLKEAYLKNVANYYDAQVDEFSKTEKVPIHEFVNKWVESKTKGMIKQLVDEQTLNNRDSAFSLINAVYFRGIWENEFNEAATQAGTFTNSMGQTSETVKFMHKTARFAYVDFNGTKSDEIKESNFKVISLPYKGGEFDMVILLPSETNGIDKLQDSLSAKALQAVLKALKEARVDKVDVEIPKFTLESKPDVGAAVKKLGLTSIFEKNKYAEMADREVRLSSIIHKTKIEVDEKGTKAAAATGMTFEAVSFRYNPKFVANHPFMFLIRNLKSNTLLFVGRVNKL